MTQIKNPCFKERLDGAMGALIINDLIIPQPKHCDFDPIAKIWSSCRKRLREIYKTDVAGLFVYDSEKEVISCSFCLNFSFAEETGTDPRIYVSRFEDTFQLQMQFFEDALISFIDDYIFDVYCELTHSHNVKKAAYEKLFDDFLLGKGLKTEKDQKKKRKREEQIKKSAERSGF